jgi:uncharacterized protein (TIGR02118 family)
MPNITGVLLRKAKFFLVFCLDFRIIPAMLKLVYCVRRLPTMSPEEFRDYWLNNHGPLVKKHAPALRMKRYVQSHWLDNPELQASASVPRGIPNSYDGLTEVWWDSLEDMVAAAQSPEGQEANRILAEDEARFVDCANSAIFISTEHTIFEF